MNIENEVSTLNAELLLCETFLEIFEDYAQDYIGKEVLDYVNGVVSMISMQSAKIREMIEIAEKLEKAIRESKND